MLGRSWACTAVCESFRGCSLLLPPPLHRWDPDTIPVQCRCSPWSGSHHNCGFQIFFKIWIIPRAAAASPFSKSKPVRSPAYKNPSVLPSGGRMWLKSSRAKTSRHMPGPKWNDQRKVVCLAMGLSARSRGLHGLQECFCHDVSVNSTQDTWVFCEQERVKFPCWK